ncbi:hypothetical protein AVEN_242687-1 [Araneus ventricosus]|uniref:Uncharacterized protein n=1 Tax=Araneus ventricosus TaxID=182803 RepID=A0A4Y2E2C5_ARAVE|nr:hypothetical protein AVEN_242687-1 [Araneus ventricosus]
MHTRELVGEDGFLVVKLFPPLPAANHKVYFETKTSLPAGGCFECVESSKSPDGDPQWPFSRKSGFFSSKEKKELIFRSVLEIT